MPSIGIYQYIRVNQMVQNLSWGYSFSVMSHVVHIISDRNIVRSCVFNTLLVIRSLSGVVGQHVSSEAEFAALDVGWLSVHFFIIELVSQVVMIPVLCLNRNWLLTLKLPFAPFETTCSEMRRASTDNVLCPRRFRNHLRLCRAILIDEVSWRFGSIAKCVNTSTETEQYILCTASSLRQL